VPSNERLVYVKPTFSTNCTFQRASRLHQMHILKIKCRLVYTKCPLFQKHDVSSTPNTYFGKQIRHLAETRMLISGKQLEIHFVKWPPVYVKHTLSTNGTFHRASRLHQMHIRKIRYRLAYGKCYLFGKSDVLSTPNAYLGEEPTRTEPNRARPLKLSLPPPSIFSSPQLSIFCPAGQ